MRLTGMALSNLARRPLRSALTMLGIAVAVGSFIVMVGLSQGIERAWVTDLRARGTHILAGQKGVVNRLNTSLDESLGREMERVEGVGAVAGELGDLMILEEDQTTVSAGWPMGCYLWSALHLTEGRLPSPGEADAALLGEAAAEALHKKAGDVLLLQGRRFTLVGVFRMNGVMGNSAVVIPLGAMQDLMQRPGKVTGFNIRVDRPEASGRVAEVKRRLQAAFPALVFAESDTVADDDSILKLFRAISWSVSAAALLIALVVMLNTLLMSVLERTRDVGVLSAVGWTSGRILRMFVLEGTLLALMGGIAGLLFGSTGLHWLLRLPRLRGLFETSLSGTLLLQVLLVTALLGILGSLYPAWRASRLSAMDALKYE